MSDIGTPKRQGLHKLECLACGNVAYQTLTKLQRGLNRCCCGDELIPVAMETAELVLTAEQMEAHPEYQRYWQRANSVAKGQAGPARHRLDFGAGLEHPEMRAMRDVLRERQEREAACRASGLKQSLAASAARSEPMPF